VSHHAIFPPVCTAAGDHFLLGLHLFGTSDHIELSDAEQARLVCYAVIHRLPDKALAEAVESLSDLFAFHSTMRNTRPQLPPVLSVPVHIRSTTVVPPFSIEEE
jgi:hypothetical protein